MRGVLLVLALVLVPQVGLGGGEAGVIDSDLQVRVMVDVLCVPEVLEALGPILMMERSIANKKLSKAGYQDWKRRRAAHWKAAREKIDPLIERAGIKIADLISHTARLYEQDAPALAAIREKVAKGMGKKCPKALSVAKLDDFDSDKAASVVVYGYREP